MAKKYLSDKELQEIINDPTSFDDLPTPDNPEDDDSDEKEEQIQSDDHDSELENSGQEEDSYIAKDQATLWRKVESAATKTKKKTL
nr:unnamed protein product [Callosobruchus chinensis]